VRVWNALTGTEALVLQGHALRSNWDEFSPEGKRIVTAGADGGVRVWDADTGVELADLTGHEGEVNTAAFSPDGTRSVTAGSDQVAHIWEHLSFGALVATAKEHIPRPINDDERRRFGL
jgi:WD40 repeat protein